MRLILLLIVGSFCLSCRDQAQQDQHFTGLELTNMDTTARPQDDFFRFANGGWLALTTIPDDRGNWTSFSELSELNNTILLEVIKNATQNPNYVEGTDQRKVANFYRVGMDSLLAEKVGAAVLAPTLAKIETINNVKALQDYLVEEDLSGGSAFFSIAVSADRKDSQKNVVYVRSGGLGLPERDYYLKTDERSRETRDKYLSHMASMFELAGESKDQSRKEALKVMAVETRLARETFSKEERRDPQKGYNKRSVGQLASMVPSLNWKVYFERLELETDSVIVTEPDFMKECQRLFENSHWSELQAYLKWMTIKDAAPYLNYA
ncbi:MAG TPA: M13 family metallopeptidase N-terminal domain-containing protein, partial [Cyclobacteriaceae bacterium]